MTTVGPLTDEASMDLKEVSRYESPRAGLVSKLTGYVSGLGATCGTQSVRAIVYSDGGGEPEDLIGVSDEVTIEAGQQWDWIDFPFSSPVEVKAGTVWMGYIAGASNKVMLMRYESSPNELHYNINKGGYHSGPTEEFGSPTKSEMHYSLYATYVPASPPPPPPPAPPSPPPSSWPPTSS
jgi:hypothetical protein